MAADTGDARPAERTVAHKRIGAGDYQNFLTNWDDKQLPVLYALIQTPVQYAALFHPAAVMGNKRPFAPKADRFDKEQILVVARVTLAPKNPDKVFEVERVVEKGPALEVHYHFRNPDSGATFSVKSHLAIWIPKHNYATVAFLENGKQVGLLKVTEGQWSVPAVKAEGK
jgi:hypothetical protein